jgi:protein gp37
MGKKTGISWTDFTHNWWWGCNEVTAEECGLGLPAGCYARDFARSARGGSWNGTAHPETGEINPEIWGPPSKTTRRLFDDKHNAEPYLWNAAAMKRNERMCGFVQSMSDLYEFHPMLDEPRRVAHRTVENTSFIDWKMLTKRIQLVPRYVPKHWMEGKWPLNAWIGFSAGSQKFFDQRAPYAVDLPAPVIFVSHEPATGPINIEYLASKVDPKRLWIITGGMSGPNYQRWPMDLQWARYVRDQCREAGIAFFYKQASARFSGKNPELDGVLHHQWPTVPGVQGNLGGVRKAALELAA